MRSRSKSTLFLMEQIVVIAVFAICAAVCVKILALSYIMTVDAVDTRNALLAAESAAESHKAFAGDMSRIAAVLSGSAQYSEGTLRVFYDQYWQPASEEGAAFVLYLVRSDGGQSVIFADISVRRTLTSDELIRLTAAVRGAAQ